MEAFCVKCKKMVEVANSREEVINTSRGAKKFLRGNCPVCKTKVSRVLGKA